MTTYLENILKWNFFEDDHTANSLFFHGTSVEAARHLIEKGSMINTGYAERGLEPFHKEFLYCFPNPFHKTGKSFINPEYWDEDSPKEILDQVTWSLQYYARINSFNHYLTESLGFSPETMGVDDLKDPKRMIPQDFLLELEQNNIDLPYFNSVLRKARERKGVIIGIDSSVFENMILPEIEEAYEVRIHSPQNFSLKYVNGIFPNTHPERRELEYTITNILG